MARKNIVPKLIVFNLLLLSAFSWLTSSAHLGWNPDAPTLFGRVMFAAVAGIALVLFICVNKALLFPHKKVKVLRKGSANTPKDYKNALNSYAFKTELTPQIKALQSQLQRFSAKKEGLEILIAQNFDVKELTYSKFITTLEEVCKLFYANVQRATNTMAVFDENEYRGLCQNKLILSPACRAKKLEIYREHLAHLARLINQNEEIISLTDELILEMARLDTINLSGVENIGILDEIRALIQNTKYYNQ